MRGLDDEEAHFLDSVYQRQGELLRDREKEEDELLEEYRVSAVISKMEPYHSRSRRS